MRQTLLRCLLDFARTDERILLLSGDHGYALFDEFRSVLPDRFLNCGVAEQNMIGVASGLAKAGFRPIVYGLASFVPMRVLEQIKLDVCYEGRQVIFLGDGAGMVYAQLGISHHCCEDLAVLRPLQGMTILSPADCHEMENCARLALECEGPSYVRIGKCDLGEIHDRSLSFQSGDLVEVTPGSGEIAWLATGSMVRPVQSVARRWPRSAVWSAPCIKPMNSSMLREICRRHRIIVTVEEHASQGGLGSIVCEVASETGDVRVCRIGIERPFLELCGSYDYLIRQHGLDVDSIAGKVSSFLASSIRLYRANAA